MIDLGISKLILIGAVALVFVGPEKLPKVARTVGTWLGKAQRYVNEVKAEVSRSVELDELRKAKESVEQAARDLEHGIARSSRDMQHSLESLKDDVHAAASAGALDDAWASSQAELDWHEAAHMPAPVLVQRPSRRTWRMKRSATPRWYKARSRVRMHVQSGAARVARHRPPR